MGEVAVSVEGLGKRYRISHQREPYGRLTESLATALRAPFNRLRGQPREGTEWIWALKDVSFEAERGEVLGIVGRNGAGKTTLLKLLSRITEPTVGRAALDGRVGSLLEVGTGFHPELTGRENVYMSGAVLGMSRAEIRRKFDEIVDFAGVEQFLDTPVKRFSSGMQVRLGFAVAAHLEPEILVVDEVLAVGDAEFQRKCLGKLEDVSHSGRTVLFVSHNMAAVEALCSSALLLDKGAVVAMGRVADVVVTYLARSDSETTVRLDDVSGRRGTGQLRFRSIEAKIRTGSPSEIRLHYEAQPGLRNVAVALGLFSSLGEGALHLSTEVSGAQLGEIPPVGDLVCRLEAGNLMPGRYSMNVYCTVNGVVADWIVDRVSIDVLDGDFYGTGRLPPAGYGSVLVPHRWSAES